MSRSQRIVTTVLWAFLVMVMLGVVGAGLWARRQDDRRDPTAEELVDLPVYYSAPAFSLIDQNEQTVTEQSLRGKVWVAAFIFTRCAGPCPMMTAKMADLQKSVPDPQVKLVSFSLDPEYDTPAVLREYAGRFDADAKRWHFLTGQKQAMFDVSAGFKLYAKEADSENPIIHSDRFLLVDSLGRVRGVYHADDPESMARLAADAAALAEASREGPAAS